MTAAITEVEMNRCSRKRDGVGVMRGGGLTEGFEDEGF